MSGASPGPTTIDLFAGAGGLSLGFQHAGFELVAAAERWEAAALVYEKNLPGHPVLRLDLSNPDDAVGSLAGFGARVIIGGPPCQDFSSAGLRDESLGRANLTLCFAEIVSRLRPDWFVMENVERATRSSAWSAAAQQLSASGYGITERVLDASLCGVPQRRKRAFAIGRLGAEPHFLDDTIDEALADRPMTLRDYYKGIPPFGEFYYRHPRSYARRAIFSIDEPSPTIRGVNRPMAPGYPGHPGDRAPAGPGIRALTTQERAEIQGFPNGFIWEGTKSETEQMIGNAVPVGLARFVAQAVLSFGA